MERTIRIRKNRSCMPESAELSVTDPGYPPEYVSGLEERLKKEEELTTHLRGHIARLDSALRVERDRGYVKEERLTKYTVALFVAAGSVAIIAVVGLTYKIAKSFY